MLTIQSPLKNLTKIEHYQQFLDKFKKKSSEDQLKLNRLLFRTDLFWLLWYGCNRKDVAHQWLLDRCKEVEEDPDGCLDLWSRDHYKTTVISFGKTIQDVLASHGEDPISKYGREVTVCIFSSTKSLAKSVLSQIKKEFEENEILKSTFPDILYQNPQGESPTWSLDSGIIVKRKSNPKEATIEAGGIVEGQPTGKHFEIRIYDDVVNPDYLTAEMLEKTLEKWQMSMNLGTKTGVMRLIGTTYHFADLYAHIKKKRICKIRKHPATIDGEFYGEPAFLSPEQLKKKRDEMGIHVFNSQMLLNPTKQSLHNFDMAWISHRYGYFNFDQTVNFYIIVDPASGKDSERKKNDFTSMIVYGACADQKLYVVDMVRDRLKLEERAQALFRLHRTYRPVAVGYEDYGMQADIEFMQLQMQELNYHFNIIPLKGRVRKEDRIASLQPDFKNGKILLPNVLVREMKDDEGNFRQVDVLRNFIEEEYKLFPNAPHDDMLDAMARKNDPAFPINYPLIDFEDEYHDEYISSDMTSTGY